MATNNYKNVSASAQIKSSYGVLVGMYVNSTNAGTIKFFDGDTGTASAGVKATGVFTSSDVFTDGETVTIGNVTYTFVDALSTSVSYQVLIGVSAAVTLDNLKLAINKGAGEGTVYSLGTEAHPQVTATTNTDTAQTVQAIAVGVAGNAIATTTTCADVAWGAVVLESGVDVNTLLNNTITPAIGYHSLGEVAFNNGLYATIGGTALDVTLYYHNMLKYLWQSNKDSY